MSETTDWIDEKYRQVYEEELLGLTRRRANDPSCAVEDIEGTLQNLYIMYGADWCGRGIVQETALCATIAAYERFIGDWKKENNS